MAGKKCDKDARIAVTDDQGFAGKTVNRDDFQGAREPRSPAADKAGGEDHRSNGQPDHLGGAHVAAQYIRRESEGRAPHDYIQQQARDDPNARPQ